MCVQYSTRISLQIGPSDMYMPHPIPNKFEENVHIEQNNQKQKQNRYSEHKATKEE